MSHFGPDEEDEAEQVICSLAVPTADVQKRILQMKIDIINYYNYKYYKFKVMFWISESETVYLDTLTGR